MSAPDDGGLRGILARFLGARLVAAVLNFATLIVLARSADLQDFGSFGTAVAVGAVGYGLANFGLPVYVLRYALERPHVVPLALYLTGAVMIALAGTAWLVLTAAEQPINVFMLAGGVTILAEGLVTLPQNASLARHETKRSERIVVARRAVPFIAAGAGFVLFGEPDYIFAAYALGHACVIVVYVGAELGRSPRAARTIDPTLEMLRASLSLWVSGAATMAQQLDVPIVSKLCGLEAAGAYTAAFRLASPVHIVTSSIVSVLVPTYHGHTDGGPQGRALLRVGYAYGLAVVVGSPIAYWLGPMVLGYQYAEYALVFSLLVLSSGFSVFGQLFSAVLIGVGRARKVAQVNVLGTGIAVSTVAVAASSGQVAWAAGAMCASQATIAALMGSSASRRDWQ